MKVLLGRICFVNNREPHGNGNNTRHWLLVLRNLAARLIFNQKTSEWALFGQNMLAVDSIHIFSNLYSYFIFVFLERVALQRKLFFKGPSNKTN